MVPTLNIKKWYVPKNIYYTQVIITSSKYFKNSYNLYLYHKFIKSIKFIQNIFWILVSLML